MSIETMLNPIPVPMRTNTIANSKGETWAVTRLSRKKPMLRETIPAITVLRYPTMRIKRPPTMEKTTHPNISGVMAHPASVAPVPSTPWTNRGIKEIAPKRAMPLNKPLSAAAENIRSLKRCNGKIGSSVLLCWKTNRARRITAVIKARDFPGVGSPSLN